MSADLSTADGVSALIDSALAALGGIDLLVNNVGSGDEPTVGFLDADDAAWTRTFDITVLATVRATRAALPSLIERRGVIVNVSSIMARMPAGVPVARASAKAALTTLGKSLAEEFGPRGVPGRFTKLHEQMVKLLPLSERHSSHLTATATNSTVGQGPSLVATCLVGKSSEKAASLYSSGGRVVGERRPKTYQLVAETALAGPTTGCRLGQVGRGVALAGQMPWVFARAARDRAAASRDRIAAAEDWAAAAEDRARWARLLARESVERTRAAVEQARAALDRARAAADRDQAAIERAQAAPRPGAGQG